MGRRGCAIVVIDTVTCRMLDFLDPLLGGAKSNLIITGRKCTRSRIRSLLYVLIPFEAQPRYLI
jgi:hypothetical protein